MIAILGHTNDKDGKLSTVAESRCNKAIEIWEKDKSHKIYATGTFGKNFNTTEKYHYSYIQKYLMQKNIPSQNIGHGVISSNTYEDILGLRNIYIDNNENLLIIVTSDFHYYRTNFICERLLYDINFSIIKTKTENSLLEKLRVKEKKSFKISKNEIFLFPKYSEINNKIPEYIYNNASNEHKHYDNLSIATITGQFVTFGFGINHLSGLTNYKIIVHSIILSLFLFLFWKLYNRTAETALTARKLMRSIEISYKKYGFSSLYNKRNFAKSYFGTRRIINWIFFTQIISIIFIIIEYLTNCK